MNQKLYEISNEILAILDMAGDEPTDEDFARLDAAEGAFEKKAEGTLLYRQQLLVDADAAEAKGKRIIEEGKRLLAIAERDRAKAEKWRNYVLKEMSRLGVKKVSTQYVSAVSMLGPPKVIHNGPIPERYQRVKTTYELDKSKVLEDFKAGVELPPELTVEQATYLKVT